MAAESKIADGRLGKRQEALWAELASNAVALETASHERAMLLRERARLWDELASVSTPACGQAYRGAAAKCRAEADSDGLEADGDGLDADSDRLDSRRTG